MFIHNNTRMIYLAHYSKFENRIYQDRQEFENGTHCTEKLMLKKGNSVEVFT